MKHTRKMALSILMTLVLLLGLLPGAAQAEDKVAVSTWSSLQAALDQGGSVQLHADLSGDATLTVSTAVTLDLNGHALTRAAAGSENGSVITVADGGDLTLTDSTVTDARTSNDVTHYYYIDEAGLAHVTADRATAQTAARRLLNGSSADAEASGSAPGYVGSFTGGYITGGTGSDTGTYIIGGGVFINGGSLVMDAGTIIGNTAAYGGGVYNNGTFTMSGSASLTGNVGATYGGGVCNYGTFSMKDGEISRNTASGSGSSGGVYNASTFVMESGSIAHNQAAYGGVLHYYGTFTMTGGSIAKNLGTDVGGMLPMGGEFRISGAPVIEGNEGAIAKNAGVLIVPDKVPRSLLNERSDEEGLRDYLASIREIVKPIVVVGRLDSSAHIGVTLAPFIEVMLTMYGNDYPQDAAPLTGVFTSGYGSINTAAPSAYFFSDVDGYAVTLNGGEAALTEQTASESSSDGSGSATPDEEKAAPNGVADCPRDETCPISTYWFDSDSAAWYHDGVHYALENGIMGGYSAHGFAPDDNTSRAMVATMLWRLEGSPIVSGDMAFVDVEDGMWYSDAVRWASSAGIITGTKIPADTAPWPMGFEPDKAVTREQLSAMLYRYAQYKGVDVSVGEDTNILSYDDAFDIMDYAIPAMQWACGAGIVSGMTNGTRALVLAPQASASRAVVATMLMRYCTEAAE